MNKKNTSWTNSQKQESEHEDITQSTTRHQKIRRGFQNIVEPLLHFSQTTIKSLGEKGCVSVFQLTFCLLMFVNILIFLIRFPQHSYSYCNLHSSKTHVYVILIIILFFFNYKLQPQIRKCWNRMENVKSYIEDHCFKYFSDYRTQTKFSLPNFPLKICTYHFIGILSMLFRTTISYFLPHYQI